MTITGMTRFVQQNYKVQNSHLTHKLPNGSLPPKEHVNPYCPEGMDITGRTDFRRIVPVDEGVANKIKSLVFESIISDVGAFIMTSLVKLVGSSIQSDSLP